MQDRTLSTPEIIWNNQSQTLLHEDEPVFEYELSFPEVHHLGLVGRWLTWFYRRMAARWERYWKEELYPRACLEHTQKRAASHVFRPWSGGLHGEVTLQTDLLLSLHFTGWEERGDGTRLPIAWGDTWELVSGAPCSLRDLLRGQTISPKEVPACLLEQAKTRQQHSSQFFLPNWETQLRPHLPRQDVWLIPDGLCCAFPLCTLSPCAEGTPVFIVPWNLAAFSPPKKFLNFLKKGVDFSKQSVIITPVLSERGTKQ